MTIPLGVPQYLPYLEETKQVASSEKKQLLQKVPTPKQWYEKLDKYVIGQEEAKKSVSVILHQHYLRFWGIKAPYSNALLVGQSGCGKSTFFDAIQQTTSFPCISMSASNMSCHGLRGVNINDIVDDINQKREEYEERADFSIVFIDEVDKLISLDDNNSHITKQVQRDLINFIGNNNFYVEEAFEKEVDYYVDLSNVLFIFAGTFQELTRYSNFSDDFDQDSLIRCGLMPELVARMGTIIPLQQLKETDLRKIITNTLNSYDDCLPFSKQEKEVYQEVIMYELTKDHFSANLGARSINIILHKLIEDKIFNMEY